MTLGVWPLVFRAGEIEVRVYLARGVRPAGGLYTYCSSIISMNFRAAGESQRPLRQITLKRRVIFNPATFRATIWPNAISASTENLVVSL